MCKINIKITFKIKWRDLFKINVKITSKINIEIYLK